MELVNYRNSPKLPPLKREEQRSPGMKYVLSDNQVAHPLPPRNTLRAHNETTGLIDTWPAHSTNQQPANVQMSLNKNNRLVISNALAEGKPEITPKPRFLENLENFLFRELKALGCLNTTETTESKLQAYREVFEYLIEEFRTYKPLLSSIKNEYELMLAYQRERIRELEPLRQMLVTLSDECDQKLMQYRDEEKAEIKHLKEEKKRLIETIVELKQDKQALQCQVDRLHEELAYEHERYRDEHDKKKLLISDLNDLRLQQEEAKLAELQREKKRAAEIKGSENAEENENDDPITLRLALKVCRQNLTDSMKRLTKMEADYGDVIPRRDYIALETVYKELEEKHDNLDKEYKRIRNESSDLKETCKMLEAKLTDAITQIDTLRGTTTPRPDWDKCALVLDGGYDRWREMSNGKSSNQLVEVLLNELSGGGGGGGSEFFTGMGTGADVPIYLRYDGELKNRHLSKRDAAITICDIWKEREEYKTKNDQNQEKMGEFMLNYFKRRFPSDTMVYEWCYNINDACERFVHNENIQFFKGVLAEEVDEELYFRERKLFTDLLEHLIEYEAKEAKTEQTSDSLSKAGFHEALKTFFKLKSSENIDALVKAAEEELDAKKDSRIEYKAIMSEDDEGKTGLFLNTIKQQMRVERIAYVREIKNVVMEKSQVSVNDLKRAIGLVDPNITEKEIDRYILWCFDVTKEEQSGNKQLETDEVIKRLENCCVYKHDTMIGGKPV